MNNPGPFRSPHFLSLVDKVIELNIFKVKKQK